MQITEQGQLADATRAIVREKQAQIASLQSSINRLTKIYVAQDIDRETFLQQKEELLLEKKACEEVIRKHEDNRNGWLERYKEWVNTAKTLREIAFNGSLHAKRVALLKVFGSNLFLDNKKARGCALKPWFFLCEESFVLEVVPPHGLEPWTN